MKSTFKASCAVAAILSGCGGAAIAAEVGTPDSGLEEITVTAQRRSESIQSVPNTIQAFSGETLSKNNILTFNDLIKYTPNVTFGSNGPGAGNIFMRGLSSGFAGSQSSATIAPFPNVALYLDEQSMTFPFRNVDVYMVDMERVEILEGPQGTLFGGGAEAGAVRYITNKPNLDRTEGYAESSAGVTEGGAANYSVNVTYNIPVIDNRLALRATIYNDRRGGYIDNVPSTFTRKPTDLGPASYNSTFPAVLPAANNDGLAEKDQNPVTYAGFRLAALYDVNDQWNVLVQQSFQNLDADGVFAQYPVGSEGQVLKPLQETSFSPAFDKDRFWNTAWTVNGQIGDIKLVYTGAYLDRRIDQRMDYTNYARTAGGFYYQCVGGPASGSNIGAGTPGVCFSPVGSWHDFVKTTHHTEELRFTTPDDWRLRGLFGAFYEDLDIKDDQNFLYKTIPSCTSERLAAFQAGGPICIGNVAPAPGTAAIDPTGRNDTTGFGEDVDRGYRQFAFFASIDYDIIPNILTITGGTRYYNYDENEMGSQFGTSAACVGIPNGTCFGTPITAATHAATYTGLKSRGNITCHVTPDAMIYYTYSEGFRPGAGNRLNSAVAKIDVNPATNQATTGVDNSPTLVRQFNKPFTYKPDTLTNQEIGFKTSLLEHRLVLNGSAYYMQWKNVQTQIFNPQVFGNTAFGINGPNYDIKGFELQLAAKVTDQLNVNGSFSYNDAKETNSPCIKSTNVVANNPTPLGTCITQVWDPAQHKNVPIVNPLGANGARPAFSPNIQFNAQGRYDWEMNAYDAFVSVGVSYTGKMLNKPSSFPSGEGIAIPTTTFLRYTMPSYATMDASFGVSKGNWNAAVFASNLTNSHASTFTSSSQFIVSQVPLRPRVIGLRLGLKF